LEQLHQCCDAQRFRHASSYSILFVLWRLYPSVLYQNRRTVPYCFRSQAMLIAVVRAVWSKKADHLAGLHC